MTGNGNGNFDPHFVYFTHRELVAQVEHSRGDLDVVEFLRNHVLLNTEDGCGILYDTVPDVRDFLVEQGVRFDAVRENPITLGLDKIRARAVTFARVDQSDSEDEVRSGDQRFSSLVFFPVEFTGELDSDYIAGLGHEIPATRADSLTRDDIVLMYLAAEFNRRIITAPEGLPESEYGALKTVSLNWLMGGAPSQVSTGGPATAPVPPEVKAGKSALAQDAWRFAVSDDGAPAPHVPQSGHGKFKEGYEKTDCPNPVNVVILDTAPSESTLAAAHKKFCDPQKPPAQRNTLLNGLIDAQGKATGNLKIAYQPEVLTEKVSLKDKNSDYDYDMADHGLFIAGIINTLAPEATVKLVQVLNDYGVGPVDVLVETVADLIDTYGGQPDKTTVVNSSLFITFPFDESQADKDDQAVKFWEWIKLLGVVFKEYGLAGFDKAFVDIILEYGLTANIDEYLKQLLLLPTRVVYRNMTDNGLVVFAAAGNDGPKGSNESGGGASTAGASPETRYPAAFEEVFGVGAWDEAYSNKADLQADEGFLAFGGSVIDLPAKGILGVYTRLEYPEGGGTNNDGLARWAGTSFATAVATGTFARLACRADPKDDPIEMMRDAVSKLQTGKGDIVPVKQGTLAP